MQPELFVKALAGIRTETTLEEFQSASGISSRSVAKSVLNHLQRNDIGNAAGSVIGFSGSDRLHAAFLAMEAGCDVEKVSEQLSWRDFEKMASEVLRSFGYKTRTNVQLTKPRMEIDVVGVSSGFAVAVDCKHWSRSSLSSISAFARKQSARARRLPEYDATISHAVPAIMTLRSESVMFAAGVPIVPVHKFKSFVMDVKSYMPRIYAAG